MEVAVAPAGGVGVSVAIEPGVGVTVVVGHVPGHGVAVFVGVDVTVGGVEVGVGEKVGVGGSGPGQSPLTPLPTKICATLPASTRFA